MSDADKAAADTAAPDTNTAASEKDAEKTPNVGEPEWLPKRLEQAKRSADAETLKALGVDSLDAAKAAIAKAKELEESKKSEIEKFSDKVKALEPEAKRAVELHAKLTKYADAELAKLSDEQRAAVLAIVGEDKTRILDTVDALRPTWAAKTAEATKADEKTKPLPQPANTSASGKAPQPASDPVTNHRATWEALKQSNPFQAAQYLSQHEFEIFPPQA
jgi:hypothetical protein